MRHPEWLGTLTRERQALLQLAEAGVKGVPTVTVTDSEHVQVAVAVGGAGGGDGIRKPEAAGDAVEPDVEAAEAKPGPEKRRKIDTIITPIMENCLLLSPVGIPLLRYLHERVDEGARPDFLRSVFVSVTAIVADAHKAGVCHNDIHLSNIIIVVGEEDCVPCPYLIDWGLATCAAAVASDNRLKAAEDFRNLALTYVMLIKGSSTARHCHVPWPQWRNRDEVGDDEEKRATWLLSNVLAAPAAETWADLGVLKAALEAECAQTAARAAAEVSRAVDAAAARVGRVPEFCECVCVFVWHCAPLSCVC